ncbi:MAG: alpha-amylase family glycosyl hydrolase [Muribaculaceae bacterium]|nr:alpha-amylase family glycosyl hydrolase [Muribaculaceae bacterium]
MDKDNRPIIYQLFPRLFTNSSEHCISNGTIEQNGVGKMNDITPNVLNEIKELGVTHIWYTGIIEHATKTDYSRYGIAKDNPHIVKGNAGSPYAIKDYYDVDPDIATDVKNRIAEFEDLVTRTHKAGLKVIMDFVPNHVARQYHSDVKPTGIKDLGEEDNRDMAFSPHNNFYYIPRQLFSPHIDLGKGENAYFEFPAKATGNDCFHAFPNQNDWYETIKLNYGIDYGNNTFHFDPIPDTWFKMLNILRYWAAKGIDGFRCDMAHMVPIEFWSWAIKKLKEKYPSIIFIAEIYDVALYRDYIYKAGFDYLYDKVNLYDTLRDIQCNNKSAATITNCWQTVDGIADKMLNFLENHDEQRIASRFFVGDAFEILPSLVVSATINKGAFMIYAGQELGEPAIDAEGFSGYDGRTTIFDYWSIPTIRRWFNCKFNRNYLSGTNMNLREVYAQILKIANSEAAFSKGDFFDLMYVNYDNINFNPHTNYAYIRHYENDIIIVALNFSSKSCNIEINIPEHAFNVLDIKSGKYKGVDLLNGDINNYELDPKLPFKVEINGYAAALWKLNRISIKKDTQYKRSPNKK